MASVFTQAAAESRATRIITHNYAATQPARWMSLVHNAEDDAVSTPSPGSDFSSSVSVV
jgi:hypothetical protein